MQRQPVYCIQSFAIFFILSASSNIDAANSSVNGPPFTAFAKSGLVNDFITEFPNECFTNSIIDELKKIVKESYELDYRDQK